MPELHDLRAKITAETAAALEAASESTGTDKSELVREILDKWAAGRIYECRLLVAALEREGLGARINGARGKGRA